MLTINLDDSIFAILGWHPIDAFTVRRRGHLKKDRRLSSLCCLLNFSPKTVPNMSAFRPYSLFQKGWVCRDVIQEIILTLIYMGYFDYLFYMGGGGGKKAPRSNSGI